MGQVMDNLKLMKNVRDLESPQTLLELIAGMEQHMALYQSGIQEIRTKLEILQRDARFGEGHNPIDSIKSRIKSPMSIIEKMYRKGFPISLDSMRANLNDVAGIRVICPFIEDIYTVAQMLTRQDDLVVIKEKDYIKNPKPNGYRSLHVIIRIPVYFLDKKELIPVEIQLRTIAMDFWASLEHDLKYKAVRHIQGIDAYHELKDCSRIIEEVESRMQVLARALDADDE